MKIFLSGLVFLFFFIMAHYLVWFALGSLWPSVGGAFTIGMGAAVGIAASVGFYAVYE